MAKEILKEMLLNAKSGDYEKIMNYSITLEDIKDFYDLYCEFASLEADYNHMILGRKDVAKDLAERLELIKQMSKLIDRDIKIRQDNYKSVAKDLNINEEQYNKVFEVLRQLAANESAQYEIKIIKFPAYDNSVRYGYRTSEEYTGEMTILCEKGALSGFESDKKMSYLNSIMLEDIYQQGFSMVLFGDCVEEINLPNKQFLGYYHPIVFCLQDDSLASASKAFINFIEENGADLNHIEIDDLIATIKSKYKKRNRQKLLTSNKN